MRIEDIDIEFLKKGMQENAFGDNETICLWKEIETELLNLIDQVTGELETDSDSDREVELQKYKTALQEVRECQNDNIAYDIYYDCYHGDYGTDQVIEDFCKKQEEQDSLLSRIDTLARKYLSIIQELPDKINVEVDFSEKSQSVYVKTEISATEENVEKFLGLARLSIEERNMYEELDAYDASKTIEIRLSDHDFGGYHRSYGYGEYMSYEKECISYVYLL